MFRIAALAAMAIMAAAQTPTPGFEVVDCAVGCPGGHMFTPAEKRAVRQCLRNGADPSTAFCECHVTVDSLFIVHADCPNNPEPAAEGPDDTASGSGGSGTEIIESSTGMAETNATMGISDVSVEVALDVALQVFVVAITTGMFIFFLFENYKGRASWEILFVSFVEATVYLTAAVLQENVPLFGATGTSPMIRYLSWMTTCPFLIKVLLTTVNATMDMSKVNKLIAADIMMNATGILACVYSSETMLGVKIALFAAGCIIGLYIVQSVWNEWQINVQGLDQPHLRRFLMILMLFSWSIFPFLFLIGPEMFVIINSSVSTVLHSLSDLIAKNFFSFVAWRIVRNSVEQAETKKKAGQFNEELVELSRKSMAIAMEMASEHSRNNDGYDYDMQEPPSPRADDVRNTITDHEKEIANLKRQLGNF